MNDHDYTLLYCVRGKHNLVPVYERSDLFTELTGWVCTNCPLMLDENRVPINKDFSDSKETEQCA